LREGLQTRGTARERDCERTETAKEREREREKEWVRGKREKDYNGKKDCISQRDGGTDKSLRSRATITYLW